jgi:hypothetical protein
MEQEILNVAQREDRHVTIDGAGVVKVKDKEAKLEAYFSNDMLLRLCMTRRGLAMDQCNILEYSLHGSWIEKVLGCRLEQPPDGYQRISLQQIVLADRKLFLKLAEFTGAGIQLTGLGSPVDSVFEKAMNHPDVLHLLQPMPALKSQSSQSSTPSQAAAPIPRPGPYTRPSKGKGKTGKMQGSLTIKMPQGLEGGVTGTKGGNAICFDHRLNKGHLPVERGRCRKGLHICCYKGCFKQDHTYQTRPARKSQS